MDQRTEFVSRALRDSECFGALCEEFGISRRTGYKWKKRFLKEGVTGLSNHSRRPNRNPKEVREDVVCRIVNLRLAHRGWGARKLRAVLERTLGKEELPSESSFKRILESQNQPCIAVSGMGWDAVRTVVPSYITGLGGLCD